MPILFPSWTLPLLNFQYNLMPHSHGTSIGKGPSLNSYASLPKLKERKSDIQDAYAVSETDGDHTLIASDNFIESDLILGSTKIEAPVLFKGIGHSLNAAISLVRYERSGNEQFTTELSKWVFHERGHLKALNVRHHKVGETDEPAMYRINDDLEYAGDIYEWSGTRVYYTAFKVPDVYGVFSLRSSIRGLDTLAYHFQKR
ncbi:hypothetical protein RJ639_017607 [Escallonia herrerae]|uniref:Uncharacterized protein n=1 Tax=Escallonia herrerae TaxID=1293975 RepID=A0AA89AMC8_9ASTE|nr:hypothetical protein RJ639_017607 [Escallonia herrerae]